MSKPILVCILGMLFFYSISQFMLGCNPNLPGGCILFNVSDAQVQNITGIQCISHNCLGFSVYIKHGTSFCTFNYTENQYCNLTYYNTIYAPGTIVKAAWSNDSNECLLGIGALYDTSIRGFIISGISGLIINFI